MRISCFHVRPEAIAIFEAAAPAGCHLAHHLDQRIGRRLDRTTDRGSRAELAMRLNRLAATSDAVLVTEPLLGPAVSPPSLDAAALLAEALAQAVADGARRIDVFYSTRAAGAALGAHLYPLVTAEHVRLTHLPRAGAARHAGNPLAETAAVLDAIRGSAADVIAVAEAVDIDPRVAGRPVLTLARTALTRLVASLPLRAADSGSSRMGA